MRRERILLPALAAHPHRRITDRSKQLLEGLELTSNEGTLVPWHGLTARWRAAPTSSEGCAQKLPTQNATASAAAQHRPAFPSDLALRFGSELTATARRGNEVSWHSRYGRAELDFGTAPNKSL